MAFTLGFIPHYGASPTVCLVFPVPSSFGLLPIVLALTLVRPQFWFFLFLSQDSVVA